MLDARADTQAGLPPIQVRNPSFARCATGRRAGHGAMCDEAAVLLLRERAHERLLHGGVPASGPYTAAARALFAECGRAALADRTSARATPRCPDPPAPGECSATTARAASHHSGRSHPRGSWSVERARRGHSPGGCRATNPAGPVPTVLQRGPVGGGLGGLPRPAAVSR